MRAEDARLAALRDSYEVAFRQFALEVQRLQLVTRAQRKGRTALEGAKQRVEEAQSKYRAKRDALAQYMLRRTPMGGTVQPKPNPLGMTGTHPVQIPSTGSQAGPAQQWWPGI